ncbi:MAG: hypothetical protein L6R37_000234 [Teloschistes peruensis]|nr:MAG: hypothetical protein L6R37_000234 [Teloschistes peruensis]
MQSNPLSETAPASTSIPQPSSTPSTSLCTSLLHADSHLNHLFADVAPPLHVSSTFQYSSDPSKLIPAKDASLTFDPSTDHIYSRLTAPNGTRLEALLTSLIGAPSLAYGSGLAALFGAYTLLNPRKVAITDGYHGVHGVLDIFKRLTHLELLPLSRADELGHGDVLHVETPLNPYGEARNVAHYASIAEKTGAVLLIDATLAPPPLQDPFAQGAHIVMHSGTKYIGGHTDLLLGVLATRNKDWFKQLALDRMHTGSVAGSMECWLATRSLRTMEVRVTRQSESASALVNWLEKARSGDGPNKEVVGKVVAKVRHASLQEEAKDEDGWLRQQMKGWGALFALNLKKDEMAKRLPSTLKLFMHATSLGGVESLMEWRAMSDEKADPTMLRVSVGLERWEDLRDDLLKGFEALVEEGNL